MQWCESELLAKLISRLMRECRKASAFSGDSGKCNFRNVARPDRQLSEQKFGKLPLAPSGLRWKPARPSRSAISRRDIVPTTTMFSNRPC